MMMTNKNCNVDPTKLSDKILLYEFAKGCFLMSKPLAIKILEIDHP